MRLSLPAKVALMTTGLVVLLVALVGVWQYQHLSKALVALLQTQQDRVVRIAAEDLNDKLHVHVVALSQQARLAPKDVLDSPQARERFLKRYGLGAMFDSLAITDLQGRVIANEPPAARGLDIGDRLYFQEARVTDRPAISPPIRSRTTGREVIAIIVPFKDEDDRSSGWLVGSLELEKPNMLGELRRPRGEDEGYFLLETQDPQPVYIAHPDASRLLQPALDDRQLVAGGDLVSAAKVRLTGWTLRMVHPSVQALAPLSEARRALLLQILLLAGVCGALVWAGAMTLMRPLAQLHRAIQHLRNAPDSDIALDTRPQDERGDLARAFAALMRELRDQRAEMALVMDASPVGLFRCDTDGRMVYVNDAYLAILGLERDQMERRWVDLLPAGHEREQLWAAWQRQVQQETPYDHKRWLIRNDGGELFLSMRMRPVFTEGRVSGQVGTVTDITQRVREERALRILTGIFEQTTDYVVQNDMHGRLIYMNPAARQRCGVAAETDITRHTIADFNPPVTLQRLRREAVPHATREGVWIGESQVWDAQHRMFPVSHMVIAHRDKDGEIEYFSAIMRDISAAKATEQALSESEARLRTMADALPLRLAYVDANECYRFVNRAYEEEFGMHCEDITGMSVKQLFGPEIYPVIEPHVRRALAGMQASFQREVLRGGSYACVEATFIPQRSVDGGEVVGFHALTSDITRQKLEERRLAKLAHQDALTGLGNRAAFEQRLPEALDRARLSGAPMALLYMDLDRFKAINDRFGHPCGDALLQAVAERLSNTVRTSDMVCRLGGDEFAVVLEGLRHADDASGVARSVLRAMALPFCIEGREFHAGLSIGVAPFFGGPMTVGRLIRQADEQLYAAKAAGRNNFQMAQLPAFRAA